MQSGVLPPGDLHGGAYTLMRAKGFAVAFLIEPNTL